MHKYPQKPELDIIREILTSAIEYRPDSVFLKSLLQQYLERGSLSKKQLQGLHDKASKINEIPTGKLATLEAKIIKMPDRFKSEIPETKPLYTKDESAGDLIKTILTKYPQHKRVLFLKSKFDNNEVLTATEIAELKKFSKLLV
ncbi:hypothetical protein FRZ67_16295 [Panacibacter ginsenosidivorans]|uniref:Uncharacterized protein n=1 Tax=Panacibacter ginsenosidivorans TaxID=1813871 RepID=A0A5B8VBC5_9BACT|nr:hypothetical protein [Panacibacter ginsenosidivorans]QEC68790.1 hypothetical protein FRZ67_16295 [Panacibacter ginsenosidivorans]